MSALRGKASIEAGTVIGARYRVRRTLGQGGMGQVLEVEHVALGRTFALKLLRLEKWTEELVRRFNREARALARVHTPRVAQVTDFGIDGEVGPFYVMEVLDGETLEDRLRSRATLPVPEALDIAAELCDALAEVHAADIVHRDLKPSNVGLPATGPVGVKLLDFGLAASMDEAFLSRITESQQILGSLPYMAPEQFNSAPPHPTMDLYAVGIVLFESLTGRLPFFAPSTAALIHQILSSPVPSLSSIAPDARVPPALEALLARLLAKEPSGRPSSADHAAALIRDVRVQIGGIETGPLAAPPYAQTVAGSEEVNSAAREAVEISARRAAGEPPLKATRPGRRQSAPSSSSVRISVGHEKVDSDEARAHTMASLDLSQDLSLERPGVSSDVSLDSTRISLDLEGGLPRPRSQPPRSQPPRSQPPGSQPPGSQPGTGQMASIDLPEPAGPVQGGILGAAPWSAQASPQAVPATMHFPSPFEAAPHEAGPHGVGAMPGAPGSYPMGGHPHAGAPVGVASPSHGPSADSSGFVKLLVIGSAVGLVLAGLTAVVVVIALSVLRGAEVETPPHPTSSAQATELAPPGSVSPSPLDPLPTSPQAPLGSSEAQAGAQAAPSEGSPPMDGAEAPAGAEGSGEGSEGGASAGGAGWRPRGGTGGGGAGGAGGGGRGGYAVSPNPTPTYPPISPSYGGGTTGGGTTGGGTTGGAGGSHSSGSGGGQRQWNGEVIEDPF